MLFAFGLRFAVALRFAVGVWFAVGVVFAVGVLFAVCVLFAGGVLFAVGCVFQVLRDSSATPPELLRDSFGCFIAWWSWFMCQDHFRTVFVTVGLHWCMYSFSSCFTHVFDCACLCACSCLIPMVFLAHHLCVSRIVFQWCCVQLGFRIMVWGL